MGYVLPYYWWMQDGKVNIPRIKRVCIETEENGKKQRICYEIEYIPQVVKVKTEWSAEK